jgi:hypothetical protein
LGVIAGGRAGWRGLSPSQHRVAESALHGAIRRPKPREAVMAVYFTPTVVTPLIPIGLITPVERFILTAMFNHDLLPDEGDGGSLQLHAEEGIDEDRRIDRAAFEALADAIEPGTDRLVMLIDMQVRTKAQRDDPDPIVSFINELDPLKVLQGIVRRHPERLPAFVIQQAFTCSRMRADGFGGAATVITAAAVESLCTTSWAAARVAAAKAPAKHAEGEVV